MLAVSLAVCVSYFLCRWAINAPALGAHDLGLTMALAVVGTGALYAALVLSVVDALLLVYGLALRRRPLRRLVFALVFALLPVLSFTIAR